MKINAFITISAFLAAAASCTQDSRLTDASVAPRSNSITEQAYPGLTGAPAQGYVNGTKLAYRLINGEAVFQGDILLHADQLTDSLQVAQGAGRTRTSARWPNKTVYYAIDPGVVNPSRITDAMNYWTTTTGIQFVARTTQRGYLLVRPGNGCSANVGYIGSVQYLTAGTECATGNFIHELGHTVGLWHEQARADRDSYITINLGNAQAGTESNFSTYTATGYDGFDNGPFDFGSVMLYDSYAYSANGQPTIVKKDGSVFDVQRTGLSETDLSTVQIMYP